MEREIKLTAKQYFNAAAEYFGIRIFANDGGVTERATLKAMDDYAKQVSVEFAEWMGDNCICDYGDNWVYIDEKMYHTKELYNIFLEQRSK